MDYCERDRINLVVNEGWSWQKGTYSTLIFLYENLSAMGSSHVWGIDWVECLSTSGIFPICWNQYPVIKIFNLYKILWPIFLLSNNNHRTDYWCNRIFCRKAILPMDCSKKSLGRICLACVSHHFHHPIFSTNLHLPYVIETHLCSKKI